MSGAHKVLYLVVAKNILEFYSNLWQKANFYNCSKNQGMWMKCKIILEKLICGKSAACFLKAWVKMADNKTSLCDNFKKYYFK